MAQKFKVCIIGGGVVGMMTALAVARTFGKGKKIDANTICLVDRNFHGTPRQHPAPLVRHGHNAACQALYQYSLQQWQQWKKDFSAEDWGLTIIGSAVVARTPEQLAQIQAWAQGQEGIKGEVITSHDTLHEVLKLEELPEDLQGALALADEGYIHSAMLYDTLRKLLIREGVIVWGGDDVRYVTAKDGKITGIKTRHDELEADNVVLCGGLSADQFIKQHELKIPLRPARCHTIECSPTQPLPPQMLVYPTPEGDIYSRPLRNGRQIVAYTGHLDQAQATASREPDPEAIEAVMRGMQNLFYGFRHAPLQEVKALTIAVTPDGSPYIGRVANMQGLYLVTGLGANTYAYAAGAAQAIADLLSGKEPAIDLMAFSPDRYL